MLSKIFKIIGILIAVIIIGVIGLLIYVKTALPNVGPAPELKVELTPERIARGKYLATSVSVCIDCHSERDWTKFTGPIKEGTFGQGGEIFDQTVGFPGRYTAKNITPYGLGSWTDGEIFRAITSGVSKNGNALFPVMPHPNYGKLDKEDIYSIVAYLRTLKPVTKDIEASKSDFPMNFIINTIPKKAEFSTLPVKTDTLAYGKYLFTAAACGECHSKQDKGQKIKGMELAGGFEFRLGTGIIIRSSNITPDVETGIGNWTREAFVNRFKTYADTSYKPHTVEAGAYNTIMPWIMYAGMEKEDLSAIYAYLKTVPPIKNKIQKYTKL